MRLKIRCALVLQICVVVSGCSGSAEHADLHEFVSQVMNQPSGGIEPLPSFNPYDSFKYAATTLIAKCSNSRN